MFVAKDGHTGTACRCGCDVWATPRVTEVICLNSSLINVPFIHKCLFLPLLIIFYSLCVPFYKTASFSQHMLHNWSILFSVYSKACLYDFISMYHIYVSDTYSWTHHIHAGCYMETEEVNIYFLPHISVYLLQLHSAWAPQNSAYSLLSPLKYSHVAVNITFCTDVVLSFYIKVCLVKFRNDSSELSLTCWMLNEINT
jgi:hypothetical protein